MRKLILIWIVFIVSCNNITRDEQDNNAKLKEHIQNSEIDVNFPVADIAILGTFHYVSNVDSYKRKYHIDITSEETQNQITDLLNKLKGYQPTKILVEQSISNQHGLDSLYQEYRKGNYRLSHDESQQLGFRLAKMLNHEHIYAVDVQAPLHIEHELPMNEWESYADKTNHLTKMNSINSRMEDYHHFLDSLKTAMPLIEYYKYLNSEKNTTISGYEKLTGLIQIGAGDKYIGADGISMDYRRNLRIYANTVNLIENDNERFLMIYGSNHKFILGHLFKSSMEFNYQDIIDYLE